MSNMSKEELLQIFDNAMTVGELKKKLEKFDDDLILVNTRDEEKLPIDCVEKTKIDYCFDEIISKEVVSIW